MDAREDSDDRRPDLDNRMRGMVKDVLGQAEPATAALGVSADIHQPADVGDDDLDRGGAPPGGGR